MNISPPDTDVRQGYALAESLADAQDSAAALAQTAGQENANSAAAQQADAPDARSQAAITAADRATARETAQKLAEKLAEKDTGLKIRVLDDAQSSVQVEVVDERSNKVLRKIPQDELIKLSASIKEMSGVLVNKPA